MTVAIPQSNGRPMLYNPSVVLKHAFSHPRVTMRRRVLGNRVTAYMGRPGAKEEPSSQIAVVNIFGCLSHRGYRWDDNEVNDYDGIEDCVIKQLVNPLVRGVVLHMDSPGGVAAGLEDSASRIVAARDTHGKRIAVHVDETCASAAYWLAVAVANAGIYSTLAGEVGSIGGYTTLWDESERLKMDGVSVTMLRVPAGKNPEDPICPVRDVAESRANAILEEVVGRFFNAVACGRCLSVADVAALDAATFGAIEAKERGLIDGICSLEDVMRVAFVDVKKPLTKEKKEKNMEVTGDVAKDRILLAKAGATLSGTSSVRLESTGAEEEPPSSDSGGSSDTKVRFNAVAEAASACAAACAEAAAAIAGGSAPEAIDAIAAMTAACRTVVEKSDLLFGATSEEPAGVDSEPTVAATRAELARQLKANRVGADQQERNIKLQKKQINNSLRSGMMKLSRTDFDLLYPGLPDRYNGEAAAATTVVGVFPNRTAMAGLSQSDIRYCRDRNLNVDDMAERIAAIRGQRIGGYSNG